MSQTERLSSLWLETVSSCVHASECVCVCERACASMSVHLFFILAWSDRLLLCLSDCRYCSSEHGAQMSLCERNFLSFGRFQKWNFWVVRSSFNFRSPAVAARAHGPTAEARGLPPLRVPTSDLRLSSCHHSHPDGAEATSPAMLTRFRVMISDAQRLFVCLLTIPISSLEQCLFGPSAHFKIRPFALVFGLCLFCMEL